MVEFSVTHTLAGYGVLRYILDKLFLPGGKDYTSFK